MTTATRSVAVVATHLPNTDRRALSQAWFSALHVAQPAAAKIAPHGLAAAVGSVIGSTPRSAAESSAAANGTRSPAHAARSGAARTALDGAAVERRLSGGVLARRIERAIEKHVVCPAPRKTSIAIKAGDGRVRLLVRNDGATTRIVALCAPHLRERVDRALAHARFALAAAGNRVEVVR